MTRTILALLTGVGAAVGNGVTSVGLIQVIRVMQDFFANISPYDMLDARGLRR